MMRFKLSNVPGQLFQSVLFGAFGGAVGGAVPMACLGVVAVALDCGIACSLLGGIYLGLLGGMVGFLVGLVSGVLGWLPSYLFPESKLASYALATCLGLLVGLAVWLREGMSGQAMGMGGLEIWAGLLLLLCGVSGAIASNALIRFNFRNTLNPWAR